MLISAGALSTAKKEREIRRKGAEDQGDLSSSPLLLFCSSSLRTNTYAHVALLALWSSFLFVYGIHQGDLYRTEGLRAIVGAEMFRSGDWLVPRLYGEPILTKPPLFYWCIAATGKIFGEVTIWSCRLPSAVAGLLAVLLVYFIVRRYYGPKWGLLAALTLPCSFLWLDKGSSAEIDTLLVLWVIGAWGCLLRATENDNGNFGWWAAALLCVAASVLTKWIGFLFFYAMAIPFLAWRKQFVLFFRWPHIAAALIGVAVVCLWLGPLVNELGGSYVWSALWKEGASKAGEGPHKHLLLDALEHPFKILAVCLPWSVVALYGLWQMIAPRNSKYRCEMAEASLICWAISGTLMMTIFPDHNMRQSFALVPAWTLLGILQIRKWLAGAACEEHLRIKPSLVVGFLCAWCLIKVAYIQFLVPARYHQRPRLDQQASTMRAFVPEAETLYLQGVKDECLMFTYGRTVKRIGSWEAKPNLSTPFGHSEMIYCILTERERADWVPSLRNRIQREERLLDAQNEPVTLVQLR
jgi:4-amino-4-deoxy-L-arabinose transferase-like glycosyltransferase